MASKVTPGWDEASILALSQRLNEPESILNLRREAFARIPHTPWPNISQEAWRRTDPREVGPHRFALWPLDNPGSASDGRVFSAPKGWPTFELTNCRPYTPNYRGDNRTRSPYFGSLESGLSDERRSDLISLLTNPPTDDDSPAMSLVHLAFFQSGAFVDIPRGFESGGKIYFRHRLNAPNGALLPLNLIKIGAQGKASVVLEQVGDGDQLQWLGIMTRIAVNEGARLDLTIINRASPSVRWTDRLTAVLGRDAVLNLTLLDLTGGWAVMRRELFIEGKGGEAAVRGGFIGWGEARLDLRTLQRHPAPSSHSDLLYKTVLSDRSRAIYQGLIVVEPTAVGANAYQLNRNLLLSADARADSIPKLEILVDDVRCTHGASAGKLDRNALFYLMSRGLTEQDAARLMIEGFLRDAFDEVADLDLQNYLLNYIRAALKTGSTKQGIAEVSAQV